MASSGNFMTWSSLWSCDSVSYPPSPDVFSGGNCRYSSSNSNNGFGATHSFLSGKWYWEVYIVANGNKQLILGLVTPETKVVTDQLWNRDGIYGVTSGSGVGYKLINQSPGFTEIDGFDDVANGDIVQLAFDRDNYKLWVGRNNTWLESGNPAGNSNPLIGSSDFTFQGGAVMPVIGQGSGSTFTMVLNAGQDDTFGGEITGAGNADENGHGVFKYTPPSGFLAPCSANLSLATELDPAEGNQPNKYFDAVTYTGNGSTQNIDSLNFQPDIVWIKNRSQSDSWVNQNSVLGVGKTQAIDSSAPVVSETDCITAFNSDGFSLGNDHKVNASSENYVAYCFKESADAGIDIVTYSGDGGTQAVSHSLGVKPKMIWMMLNTGSGVDGTCFMDTSSMGTGKGVFMSLSNGAQSTTYVSATSSSSFSVTSSMNSSSRTYFAYLFAEKEGFSKYGEFEGNGNADGPFIYTGFRPRLVFCKAIDASENWQVRDTARFTSNTGSQGRFYFNSSAAEGAASTASPIDFLSNGFKVRGSNSEINSNTIIYGAWGDVPFKYNNTF